MKKFSSITRVNSRRISQNKKRIQIVAVATVSVVLLFLVPTVLSNIAAVVISPINITKTWLTESGNSLPQYFRDRSVLVNKITTLQSQIAESSGDKFTVQALSKENAELRSLLGSDDEKRILAAVIARPGVLPYDSLLLDIGSTDGILVGAPVYIGDNTLIGIVKNTTPHSSLVELITTSGFEATVYIIGPDIYTTAYGIGGGQLRVGVPQGVVLQEGDTVVLPSVSSGVYGEISFVQSEATQPEQYGFVAPEIAMASIRFVSVGVNPLQHVTFEQAQENLQKIKTTLLQVPVPDEILIDTQASTTDISVPSNQSEE